VFDLIIIACQLMPNSMLAECNSYKVEKVGSCVTTLQQLIAENPNHIIKELQCIRRST
jgi:hypothetical protein